MKYTDRNRCHTTEQHRQYHETHGVIPVDYDRRAPWFEKRIVKRFNLGPLCEARFNWWKVDDSSFFDHYGVIQFDDHLGFVTEPYVFGSGNPDEQFLRFTEKCQWLATEIQCDWWTSPHSFWNPGHCARGVFYEGPNTLPYKLLKPR